jgi:hypothetical protein
MDRCWQQRVRIQAGPPKAIIAPHAGMIYSGPIAASAYATLAPVADSIRRVVLLGPSHHYGFDGFAIPAASRWATPLGEVPLDGAALANLALRPDVQVSDAVHQREHSLEIHLPFLQRSLGAFRLIPVAVGRVQPDAGGGLLRELWGGHETLIVISSDLSHFLDQQAAQAIDRRTSDTIEAMDARGALDVDACGRHPIACLLAEAQRRGMRMRTVDLRTSADTAGDPQRVVGYGSYLFWPGDEAS